MAGEVFQAMPIYEYVCTNCGAETEVIQRFSDPPLETCTSCAGALRKKISPSAFHLKGTGWYVTDYARKSAGGNGSEGEGKAKSEGTSTAANAEKSSTEKPPAAPTPKSSESAKET
jgi:putative FmdB family regulatory protein